MRTLFAAGCALLLAAAPAFAQDTFEPNPSLARLSADDKFARASAKSLQTARIDGAVAIRLDDAGRVLVAGRLRIARLDAAGGLDPTFGDAGVVALPVLDGALRGLEIDAAGRIVVTGDFYESYGYWLPDYVGRVYWAARLLDDGSPDPAFSGDGLLERDAADGLIGLGAVRAAGDDGAMLAVATKPIPTGSYRPLVGLVRIASDGTLDAAYGSGGFAEIVRRPPGYFRLEIDSVSDFAVDPAGRAVVAVRDAVSGFGSTVQRLDAAGVLDSTFWSAGYLLSYYLSDPNFTSSSIALDDAGRVVGLDHAGARFLRRLPDGAPDPTFSGDGFAWNQAAFLVGLTPDERAALYAAMSQDPDYDGGDGEFLAVAARADRWALARPLARGIEVRAIDPADPGAIISATYRRFSGLAGLAISPDGSTAYAFGAAYVLRVDLAKRKALPLPDLRVKWLGWPHARDFAGGRYRVSARVRISNVSRNRAASVYGQVGFGDGEYAIPLDPYGDGSTSSRPFRLRARSSVVKRFTWEGTYGPADLAGASLAIKIACELPDATPADNTATSRTISPLYAPR